ncbi:putative adenylyltransferase/sulfurtransferase MoeZ [Candidatus Gullanella endobia]|uniref:tRNA uridine(34) hydroxylase n=1 Tax=Candidatus Gullanella endobia TaxID=1070130 RepID=A0A143WTW7_9ENTR|nr:rhodanese-related sulfurtransferase [Candidatus Gullanella endobia]CUX96299.1 putative adenylyltransferase/sulfurtransferase MoeZ [Candidatus Gullanella endobia]
MPVLHNKISNYKLRTSMLSESEPRITISFYRYFILNNPHKFRDNLYRIFNTLQIFGRIYIASEGINAQISVPKKHFNKFRKTLYTLHPQLNGLRLNIALEDNGKSFWVLRMKVRPRIIADGINDSTFNPSDVGHYLKAELVNAMADDPKVLFVDMRNHYEYEVGHFNQAIEIPSNTFREQLSMVIKILWHNKDKKIVIYCTGGIRCEKASAWMRHNGFKNIYQVEGGIIEYVRRAREKALPLKFIGKNFVFDERLGERITPDIIAYCHQCGKPCDSHTNCQNQNCNLLFIQCHICNERYIGCCSITCQEKQSLPLLHALKNSKEMI